MVFRDIKSVDQEGWIVPITAESLPLCRPDTYPRDMAREATNLEIAALRTEASPEALMTRTGLRTAVPELFTAYFSLVRPPLDVRLIVRVPRGGVAQIKHLEIDSSRGEPTITSGHLRGVALDKLLREALKDAEVTVIPRDEINPDAFRLEGDDQATFRIQRPVESRTERRRLDLAARAAKVYLKAVEEGSRAPAEAVAAALNRSRSQAAVYIRLAREEGWIPPRDDSEMPGRVAPGVDIVIGEPEAVLSDEFRAAVDEAIFPTEPEGVDADVDRPDQNEDQA